MRADLVIGVGNPLRGDDGVGWWLARLARRADRAGLPIGDQTKNGVPQVRLVPQLTPELALEVAAARRVLFVDAWCGAGAEAAPTLRPLRPGGGDGGADLGHGLDPAALLALASLFAEEPPPAWLLLVPAFAFPHGTVLSLELRHQLPEAKILLQRWLMNSA
jgi:hydrogenase maturation protease